MRDEDYVDGIKLPTDENRPWEIVTKCGGTLYRIKIDNGWLYLKTNLGGINTSMCFVPDNLIYNKTQDEYDGELPTIKTLTNIVGELSMKLNSMESSLREFEKQKVDRIRDSISDINMSITNYRERIKKIEDNRISQIDHNKRLHNRMVNNEIDWSQLKPRIEKLESFFSGGFVKEPEKQECNHEWEPSELYEDVKICNKCSLYYSPITENTKLKLCSHGIPVKTPCTACY